jgi:hypothetical protein
MSGFSWRRFGSVFGLVLGIAFFLPDLTWGEEIASARAKQVGHATINKVLLNGLRGGRGNPVAVKAGSRISVDLGFNSDSSGWCPKCSNQIVVGYARERAGVLERLPGGKCVYSGTGRHSGEKLTFRMAAPKAPGNYRMIVSAPQAYNCTKALRWRATPHAVAVLDVKNR